MGLARESGAGVVEVVLLRVPAGQGLCISGQDRADLERAALVRFDVVAEAATVGATEQVGAGVAGVVDGEVDDGHVNASSGVHRCEQFVSISKTIAYLLELSNSVMKQQLTEVN